MAHASTTGAPDPVGADHHGGAGHAGAVLGDLDLHAAAFAGEQVGLERLRLGERRGRVTRACPSP